MRALREAARVAREQDGIVTREQLLSAGLGDRQIRRMLASGAFAAAHRGVYRACAAPATRTQEVLAACLACGAGAVASFATAGDLWGFCDRGDRIEVTVPHGRRPRRRGIVLHRTTLLRGADRTRRGPLALTTPARTLADLASRLSSADLELACDRAIRGGLVTPTGLVRFLARPQLANWAGSGALRAIARDRLDAGVLESPAESRLLAAIRAYGLPEPARQHEVGLAGRRVRFDLAYPDALLAVEVEGRAPHWGRQRWQADHDRHNAVELAGWRTLHFTWADVTQRPAYVAWTIAEKLGLRPVRWTRRKGPG